MVSIYYFNRVTIRVITAIRLDVTDPVYFWVKFDERRRFALAEATKDATGSAKRGRDGSLLYTITSDTDDFEAGLRRLGKGVTYTRHIVQPQDFQVMPGGSLSSFRDIFGRR